MKLAAVLEILQTLAPLASAEAWDNVGLICGDPSVAVPKIILCIDATPQVVRDAIGRRAGLLVAYHPPIFKPINRLTAENVVYTAIRGNLAIYSPHTAFDVAQGGTNDVLAAAMSLRDVQPLLMRDTGGIGRIGNLPSEISGEMLLNMLKRALSLDRLLVIGDLDKVLRRVAICAGSGGAEFIHAAIKAKADAYLTGELRHHDALLAQQANLTTFCTLHSNSERPALASLAERLREKCSGVEIELSNVDADPFVIL